MSRYFAVPVFALTAIVACGRSDRDRTTSSGASTPVVSGSTISDSAEPGRPEAAPISYERAESTYSAGRYAEAGQLFTAYTQKNPENPWGYYMLGLAAWKSGDRDQALSAFDRSIELDPNHRKSLYNSSRVLLEVGKAQQALERIETALSQEPASSEGLRLLGRARYELGQVDQAIGAYHRALTIDDRDVWSMNNLGLIYIQQGRPTEALSPLARAVQLRSKAPVFQNNLGVALERSGYPEAAARAYEAALKADSTYGKASVALSRVTAGGEQSETQPIDLEQLAAQFESEIAGWQGTTPADSTGALSQSAIDSTTSSIEAKSDTLEDCEHEE